MFGRHRGKFDTSDDTAIEGIGNDYSGSSTPIHSFQVPYQPSIFPLLLRNYLNPRSFRIDKGLDAQESGSGGPFGSVSRPASFYGLPANDSACKATDKGQNPIGILEVKQ